MSWKDKSEEERREMFEQWNQKKEQKSEQNKIKNKAKSAVIARHKPEFDQLVKDEMKAVKVEQPDEKKIKEIIQTHLEKKVRSKGRQSAKTKFFKAHDDELKKEIAKVEKAA